MDLTATEQIRPTVAQLVGWTPVRVDGAGEAATVDWCYTAGEEFADPFFDQSVERCLRRPFRLLFRHQTPMSALAAVAAGGDALPLAGLVFHCSRCGSTLVSQMLARLASTLVLSEPGPLQSLLTQSAPVTSLRAMVAALGQRRRTGQRHLVLKLDAWAVFDLPLLAQAFPGTPWIFLYRDPIEVLVSQAAHRGYHMIPGSLSPHLLGFDHDGIAGCGPEEYMARVLGSLLAAGAQRAAAGRSMLVNYRELPEAVADRIAPRFGITLRAGDGPAMREAADHDAKNPNLPFAPDAEGKRQRASAALRQAATRWAEPAYDSLEELRAGQR